MEILVLDEQFQTLYNLDVFESLIWTERYMGAGNFEFYSPVNNQIQEVVRTVQDKMGKKLDCYAWLKESGSAMIIDSLEIKTDVESGNHLIVSGSGLESILKRRIVWEQTTLNGNLQNGIKKLIEEAIISPKIEARKIPNFLFSTSTNPYVTGLSFRAQYTGDELYDTIMSICEAYELGFDVVLDQNNQFVFSLTYGEDRSYDQDENPYVVFSPKYENIINSDYLESITTMKNVTLVAGEDQGVTRRTRVVGSASGLSRRELYTDARDIQSDVDNTPPYYETENSAGGTTVYIEGQKMPDEEYNALLDQRGREKLAENVYTKVFTGETETTKTFVYGEDFFIGDIVQITNEYGMESKVRVSEVVRVQDTSGYSMYPTFQVIP